MGVNSENGTTPNGEHNNNQQVPPVGLSLTKEFLEFAFDKKVERFSVSLGSNPGDNYLSIMHAVEVVFKGVWELPKHYVIKTYPNHPGRREMLDHMNVFDKELFIYQEFLPKLDQEIGKGGGADPAIVGLSAAPFHGGNVAVSPSPKWKDSEWAQENFIIMSDIRKSGYKMADRINGLDLEHAKLALQELARWHALAWTHKERNGWATFSQIYPNMVDHLYGSEDPEGHFSNMLNSFGNGALKVSEDTLGADHPAHVALKQVVAAHPRCYGDTMRMYARPLGRTEEDYEEMLRVKPEVDKDYNKDPWLTATHGDCWVNNMLFRYDTIGDSDHPKPVQVTFVDLQMYREACPTIDLVYFLFTSVRAPLRIPHKDELLQVYHDAFIRCCKELNVGPYPGFSMKSLKRRFRRSERFGLLSAIMGLIFVLKPPEQAVDMDKDKSVGETAGVDMLSNLVQDNGNNTKFQDELIPTVLDLYENGVI